MTGCSRPFGVGVIGCGNISKQYLKNLTAFPDVAVVICADVDVDPGQGAGGRLRRARVGQHGRRARSSRRPADREPDHPRRPRRGDGGRHRGGQARVEREAADARRRRRPRPAQPGGRGRGPRRLRAGHRARRRPADRQAAHRLRGHRDAADRAHPAAGTGAAVVAPGPGVPVRAGRGPAVRPRAVLPVRARDAVRPGRGGWPPSGAGRASHASSAPGRARARRSTSPCPPTSRRSPSTSAARPRRCCSAGTRRCRGRASSRSPAPRRRWPSPTRTGSTATSASAGRATTDWTVIPAEGAAAGRGTGVVDMVRAIRAGEPHRASGEMALHVLEMMTAIERSAVSAAFEPVESRFAAPAPLDTRWDPYVAAELRRGPASASAWSATRSWAGPTRWPGTRWTGCSTSRCGHGSPPSAAATRRRRRRPRTGSAGPPPRRTGGR